MKQLSRSEIDFMVLMAIEGQAPEDRRQLIEACDRLLSLLEASGGLNIVEQTEIQNKPVMNPDDFKLFWLHYPRKVGRVEAENAYRKEIERHAPPHEILRALKRYRSLVEPMSEVQSFRHASQFLAEWEKWLEPKT